MAIGGFDRQKIFKFLKLRHNNEKDYMLTDDTLYVKFDALTKPFISGIDSIFPYKLVYPLKEGDEMFKKGFVQAILFDERFVRHSNNN